MTELDWLRDIIEALEPTLLPHGITKWLDTPMQKLQWATPIEAINRGNGEDVLAVAQSYREFVY